MNGISDSNNIPDDDLITIVSRYWKVILVIVILSGLTGFLYFLNATPVYTSKAKIYFRDIERPKDAFFLYAQTKSIVIYSVIERAIKVGCLDKLKTLENIQHPADYISTNLDISVGKKDGIITISFDSENPSDAAMIINSVVKSYIEFYITSEQQKCLSKLKEFEEEKAKSQLRAKAHANINPEYKLRIETEQKLHAEINRLEKLEKKLKGLPKQLAEEKVRSTETISQIKNGIAQILAMNQSGMWKSDPNYHNLESAIQFSRTRIRSIPQDIVILEDARPAVFPSRPDKDRIIIVFLGMGLIIGCGTAVMRNYFASQH